MFDDMTTLYLAIAGAILVFLLICGLVFARLYQRSSKEVSFVRTGFGGQKVIMNGGALVLPGPARDHPGQHEHAAPRSAPRATSRR